MQFTDSDKYKILNAYINSENKQELICGFSLNKIGTKLVRYLILKYCSCFLVNTADRIIRVYESGEVLACGKDGEPEPIQKLQDLVNKYV